MISAVLALTLTFASAQADAANAARNSYMDCMRDFMRASLRQRMDPAAFETALSSQCNDRADRFRAALVAFDLRNGGNRQQTEEDVRLTIEETRANTLEHYRVYYESETLPD